MPSRSVRATGTAHRRALRRRGQTRDAAEPVPGEEDETSAFAAAGRWLDAARLLATRVRRRPDDAKAHRELARVALELARWNGSVDGDGRFRTLASRRSDGSRDDVLTDPLRVAHDAMERAVALRPDSLAWQAPLGQLRELTGDLQGAIERYEVAVAGGDAAPSAWVGRSRHLWTFWLERARHTAGSGRVEDPLFSIGIDLEDPSDPDPGAAGAFQVRATHQGVTVGGFLTAGHGETVDVLLDGIRLRTANLGEGSSIRRFDVLLQRATVDRLPPSSRLEVRTGGGRGLLADGRAAGVWLTVPSGAGDLAAMLDAGVILGKKGALTLRPEQLAQRQATYLELYEKVATFFDREVGTPLFVLYGTLLGVHRQGDLIPGDDDVDAGYLAQATDPVAVKAEARDLILRLVDAGFIVSVNRRGRLFRVHREGLGDRDLHIDVHPIWFTGGQLYVPNATSFPSTVDDWLPADTAALRGTTVRVPRRPEVFLERHYGPGWRIPDPGYAEDADAVDDRIRSAIDTALLDPAEQRELAAEVDARRAARPGTGRFVPIAQQPLYPLADLLE